MIVCVYIEHIFTTENASLRVIVKMFTTICFKCTSMGILGTKFGAMLDQLTDRCGTMGLLVTLSYFYPAYMFLFQLSMAIDVSCHWLYMQA